MFRGGSVKAKSRMMMKSAGFSTALCASLALFISQGDSAAAQEAADGARAGDQKSFALEEILVTARRREESLQSTPIAITAISGTALEERGVEQISDVSDMAPNVNFSFGGTSSGSGSAAVVFIRGVGQNDFTPVTDPGVGIYVDDVYLGRTIGSVLDVFDLKRVEVLRGPQGTLFGRNTIGGAISLTSSDPTDELSGRVRVIAGEDNRYEAFASLSAPVSEKLRATISGLYRVRDGYVKRVDGVELGDDNVLGGRIKVVLDATDSLKFTVSFDGVREREESAAEVSTDILENAPFINFYNNNTFGNGAHSNCAGGGSLNNPLCANDQYAGAPYRSFETGPSVNDVDSWGGSLVADWQLNENIAVKSVTAYRDLDATFARSSDGTPFLIFQTTDQYTQHQFSQELRFVGNSFANRFHWIAGAFYFKEKATDLGLIEGIIPNFPRRIGGDTDNENYAFFGEAVYDVTPDLHVTGGVRYTDETKHFTPTSISLVTGQVFVPSVDNELSFNEVTWRGSLSYDIADQSLGYFTISRGFKSGGFVLRISNPAPSAPTFDPETVTQYELGLKTEFPSVGLRLNLAAFYSDYANIQVSANPAGEFNTITANAAKARIKGIEAEFTFVPVRSLIVDGSFGYQDAEYTRIDPSSNVEVSLEDNLIRTPKWSWNVGVSYLIDLDKFGSLTPRVDLVHRSRIDFEPVNDVRVAEDGYYSVDAALTYEDPDSVWRAKIGVTNLTDEKYMIAGDSNGTIGYAMAVFARPQSWYLSLERSF